MTKALFNINDTHVGPVRVGGTTPATAFELRQQVLQKLRELLALCVDGDVLINGDLFDGFLIAMSDLWECVQICSDWIKANPGCALLAARGNHDIAKNTTMMSSFDLFCRFMKMLHFDDFVPITEPTYLGYHNAYVVPHLPNQDLFDAALKAIPQCRVVFVHANYDNKFAVEADHSLNVSPDQARAVPSDFIVFGHEHQRRTEQNGKVVIVGNQIPTSVADCLGNDAKYMLKITDAGLEHIPVWTAAEDFLRADWTELGSHLMAPQRFIRVQGEATSAQAAEVVSVISKFRSRSKALVITNAVSIDGQAVDDNEIKLSLEGAKSFDVLGALMELLEPEEQTTITELLKDSDYVQARQAD